MGVHDLLKIFKPVLKKIHISEFKGKTVAVDMMTWLYRGVYSCCNELNSNIQTDLYLNYPLKMISMLTQFNIKIIAVFDGKDLKAKAEEDTFRLQAKEKNLELAAVIESTGDTEIARKVCKRALTVSDKMINTMIAILKKFGIQCYSAPYEADAQIAYLCRQKLCDVAISEDSDLIPYGCPSVIYKLTPDGEGFYFDWNAFKNSNENISFSKELSLIKRLPFINFIEYCVMLGCDYLDSLKGYGVKGGTRLFNTYSSLDTVYEQMCEIDKFKPFIEKFIKDNKESYLSKAKKAVSLFLLQTIYNPRSKGLAHLNNLDLNKEYNDAIMKYDIQFTSKEARIEYYGKQFDDSYNFCNNNYKITDSTLIESEYVINKFYNKYKDTCTRINNPNEKIEILEYYEVKEQIEDKTIKKKTNLILDDEELELLFKSTKREYIEETKEKLIGKKVEELVKIQIKSDKPIKSLGDLLIGGENTDNKDKEDNNNFKEKVFNKKIFLGKKTIFKFQNN